MSSQLKTYTLASGTSLFKGDTPKYLDYVKTGDPPVFESDMDKPAYFALNQKAAEGYGVAFKYRATRDYHLLEIGDLRTMQMVYEQAPANIQEILTNNYGYDATNHQFGKRNSVYHADKTLSTYVCNQDYDGYILTEKMKTDFSGSFHAELAICRDQDGLVFQEIATTSPAKIKTIVDKYTDRQNNPSRKGKRPTTMEDVSEEEAEAGLKRMMLTSTDAVGSPAKMPIAARTMYGTPPTASRRQYGTPPTASRRQYGTPPTAARATYRTPPRTRKNGGRKSRKTKKSRK